MLLHGNRFALIFLLMLLVCGALWADDEEEKKKEEPKDPRPDIRVDSIDLPAPLHPGPGNKVSTRIRNTSEENNIEVPIKIRLVVITENGQRTEHMAELDKLNRRDKKDVVFENIELTEAKPVRFLVIVDPDKEIEETSETNNRRIFKAPVTVPTVDKPESKSDDDNKKPDDEKKDDAEEGEDD